MNKPITRLAVAGLILVGSLIVATTYWQAWAAPSLAERQNNAIQRVAQFRIKRGLIYAADRRTVLARNVVRRVEGQTLYFRRYPTHGLAAHAVGYSTQERSRTGVERSLNDYLTGANANLDTVVDTWLDRARGTTITGNDLILGLDLRAQRIALRALHGHCGAAVALGTRSGRVLTLASSPTYDPNLVESNFGAIRRVGANCRQPSPLLNRATAGLFPPGSIFKVVTASAALDSGRFKTSSSFYDPGYCEEYGKRVNNYDTSTPFGWVSFVPAMQYSVNSFFCNVGKSIGGRRIVDYSKRFGFYAEPPVDLPSSELAESGLYKGGELFTPQDEGQVDPGRLAFGQERMLVSPLQMAMVASTIANGGLVIEPHLVSEVRAPNGRLVTRERRTVVRRAIKRKVSHDVAVMMEAVVAGGTGTAAQLPGVRVAGKTGTAETGIGGKNVTWFICYAPVDSPRVAVAVALQEQSGSGGKVSAPIARSILQALLANPSNF